MPYLDAAMRTDVLSESRIYQTLITWLTTQDLPAQGHDWGITEQGWPWATFARFTVNEDLTGSVSVFDLDENGEKIPDGDGYLTHEEPVTWTTLPPGSGTVN